MNKKFVEALDKSLGSKSSAMNYARDIADMYPEVDSSKELAEFALEGVKDDQVSLLEEGEITKEEYARNMAAIKAAERDLSKKGWHGESLRHAIAARKGHVRKRG